ncbi:Protein of unknown function [Pyronema omphalodes CBS 100304]|uniref:Uncharacterized protein n=1 Tax=Pyronema omphalodes (strain CBS 100304) TaxID=1076935 RepID=U4L1J4_PYROM|nr:Protein of unknown function [Pyronema omphalodes CBS 100304]
MLLVLSRRECRKIAFRHRQTWVGFP